MEVTEFFLRLRAAYLNFFGVLLPELTELDREWLINLATEKGYPIDNTSLLWIYSSSTLGDSHPYSGICHAFSSLGLELCTDKVERYFICYHEESYDSGEERIEPEISHSFLKVGDKYFDILYPEGLEDYRQHILFQEQDGFIFYILNENETNVEFTSELRVMLDKVKGWLNDHI